MKYTKAPVLMKHVVRGMRGQTISKVNKHVIYVICKIHSMLNSDVINAKEKIKGR